MLQVRTGACGWGAVQDCDRWRVVFGFVVAFTLSDFVCTVILAAGAGTWDRHSNRSLRR